MIPTIKPFCSHYRSCVLSSRVNQGWIVGCRFFLTKSYVNITPISHNRGLLLQEHMAISCVEVHLVFILEIIFEVFW